MAKAEMVVELNAEQVMEVAEAIRNYLLDMARVTTDFIDELGRIQDGGTDAEG